jgi:hypothetical protein
MRPWSSMVPCFGNVPHLGALPIIEYKVNIIENAAHRGGRFPSQNAFSKCLFTSLKKIVIPGGYPAGMMV